MLPAEERVWLDKARALHQCDEIEIDDTIGLVTTMTSEADDGVWVRAWVWVPKTSNE